MALFFKMIIKLTNEMVINYKNWFDYSSWKNSIINSNVPAAELELICQV